MSIAVGCEWCSNTTRFRIICREKRYERYACDQHQAKIRKLAELDGFLPEDIEECHSLAGPYLFGDLLFKVTRTLPGGTT